MKSVSSTVTAIVGALMLAGQATAQPAQPAPSTQAPATPASNAPSTTVDEVVVTAARPGQTVRNFVADVAAPVRGEGQLARWDRTICPGVAGMRGRYAQVLLDRIAVAAYRVGLDVGEPGCRPNVLVFATSDSNALARDIVENNHALVSFYGDTGNAGGRAALRDFESTARPVRWWHVTRTMTSDGLMVGRGQDEPTQVTVRGGGRLRRNTRQDFDRVVIVLDVARAQGVPFGAISDYIAMVALAQLDPTAATGAYPTVLNLFADQAAGRPAPAGLTDWDVSYLQGLYGARRDARSVGSQVDDITRTMRTDRQEQPQAPRR